MPLQLVISGGQTGADRAGLQAAKLCGLATGGWMPKGFRALDGLHPEFAREYGIQEHMSLRYPPRTRLNVQHANATIRFARNWQSHGEVLTLKYIHQFKRPWFDVDVTSPSSIAEKIPAIVTFLVQHQVTILNIAGNAEQNAPGIETITRDTLCQVFRLLS